MFRICRNDYLSIEISMQLHMSRNSYVIVKFSTLLPSTTSTNISNPILSFFTSPSNNPISPYPLPLSTSQLLPRTFLTLTKAHHSPSHYCSTPIISLPRCAASWAEISACIWAEGNPFGLLEPKCPYPYTQGRRRRARRQRAE